MSLEKRYKTWGITLLSPPALGLLLGLIPGMAIVRDQEEPEILHYGSLIQYDGWNNDGITASLLMLLMVYGAALAFFYLKSQSTGVLKALLIFGIVTTLVGIFAMFTETLLLPLPFAVFPLLMAVESVLTAIHLRAEIKRGY